MTVRQHASRPRGRSSSTRFSLPLAPERAGAMDGWPRSSSRRTISARGLGQADHGRSAGREDLAFAPNGVRCTAWQWWPDGTDAGPCVVVAYGYSGPGEQRPDPESLTDARLVMLPDAVADAMGSALG